MSQLEKWAYPWTCAVVFCFGLGACIFSFVRERRQGFRDNTEFFLTARNSVGTMFIAWSFYASAMGSWALFSVPSYSFYAGWVGLMMYSVCAGFPVLAIATIGTRIRSHVPGVLSFSDYVLRRFGWVAQLWISAVMLFNMGIGITAEYTAMGDYFEIILHSTRVPIVIIVGVISSVYTAYGGLYVSIITDQAQALLSVILILVMVIYVSITFREPLPPLPAELSGKNYTGLASIAVMPISLICASVFSEGLWQRCWASASNRTLLRGAFLGSAFITIAVFFFGFLGFLAIWSGVWQYDYDDINVIMFEVLNVRGEKTWLLTLVACLAVTMSTSNIDTYQNAIVDNISSIYLRRQNVLWTRLLVLALNVPCIVTSLQGYGIINLFLLANLITTTSTLPVLAGLITTKWAHRVVTPASMIFGCWLGLTSVVVYARVQWPHWQLQELETSGGSFSFADAMHRTFFESYDWPPFVLALGFSVVGLLLMAVVENIVRTILGSCIPWLQYSDSRVRALREPAPLPKPLNLGIGEKLAHVDFPGKPAQMGPPKGTMTNNQTYEAYPPKV